MVWESMQNDLDIINEELRLKDEESFMKNFEDLEKKYTRGEKKLKQEYEIMCKIKDILIDQKKHIRFGDWNANDVEILNKHLFITAKPMLYLINLSEKDFIRHGHREYLDTLVDMGMCIRGPTQITGS